MALDLDPRLQRAIADHLGQAEAIAWKFIVRVPGADADEFKQIAAEALVSCGHKWIPYCDRNGFDPWDPQDAGRPEKHWPGYVSKTVNGALLDHLRREDYLSRAARQRVKSLQRAEGAGARSEDELARVSGLTVAQVRDARADSVRPVYLDDHPDLDGPGYGGIADDGADVEAEVTVRQTLDAVVAAFDALPPIQRVLVALVFHRELDIAVAAEAVYLESAEARQQLEEAVLAVHRALLQAVTIS